MSDIAQNPNRSTEISNLPSSPSLNAPNSAESHAGKSQQEIDRIRAEEMIQGLSDVPNDEPKTVVSVTSSIQGLDQRPDHTATPDPYVASPEPVSSTELKENPITNQAQTQTPGSEPVAGFETRTSDYENMTVRPARSVDQILALIPGYEEPQQPAETEKDRPRSQSLEQEVAQRNVEPKSNRFFGARTPLAPNAPQPSSGTIKPVVDNFGKADPPTTESRPTAQAVSAPVPLDSNEKVFAPVNGSSLVEEQPRPNTQVDVPEPEVREIPKGQFAAPTVSEVNQSPSPKPIPSPVSDPYSGEDVYNVQDFSGSAEEPMIPIAGAYREVELDSARLEEPTQSNPSPPSGAQPNRQTDYATQPVPVQPTAPQPTPVPAQAPPTNASPVAQVSGLQVPPQQLPAQQPPAQQLPVQQLPAQQLPAQQPVPQPPIPSAPVTQVIQMVAPAVNPAQLGNELPMLRNQMAAGGNTSPAIPAAVQLPGVQQPVQIVMVSPTEVQPKQSSCRSNSTDIDDSELAAAFEACGEIADPVCDEGIPQFSEETFGVSESVLTESEKPDEVFMAGEGDVINIDGDDGFEFIDLACFDISHAKIEGSKIIVDDSRDSRFEINFKNIDYVLFANGQKVALR